MKYQYSGFTLIEVLITMLIFATTATMITSRVGDVSTQIYSIERKTIAHWVGENELTKYRLSRLGNNNPIKKGKERTKAVMGGRQWTVHQEITDTQHPWLRRIDIKVYEEVDGIENGPIDSVIGYIGRY